MPFRVGSRPKPYRRGEDGQGLSTMKKTLLIAGALLLTTVASSAFAQGYYGGSYGGYYGRSSPYVDYARQMREERRHARLHQELDSLHAYEHYQGFDSRADHR